MRTALQVGRLCVLTAMLCVLELPSSSAAATTAAFNDPWSVSSGDPIIAPSADKATDSTVAPVSPELSLTRDFAYGWLRFYQTFLSPVGTVRCPMVPSCSRYSIHSINTHGVVIGILMTADRLLHEADEKRWAMQVRDGGEVKYLDPLENNDFWWYRR